MPAVKKHRLTLLDFDKPSGMGGLPGFINPGMAMPQDAGLRYWIQEHVNFGVTGGRTHQTYILIIPSEAVMAFSQSSTCIQVELKKEDVKIVYELLRGKYE